MEIDENMEEEEFPGGDTQKGTTEEGEPQGPRGEKPTATKKRQSAEITPTCKTYATTTKGPLRSSLVVSHTHLHPMVIVEASVRISEENKAAQFLGQIGTILTNGKILDPHFVINLVIMGIRKKDRKEAKDVPTNMTAVGGYIKISTRSLLSFGQRSSGWGNSKKATAGNSMDLVYFTLQCHVTPSQ